MQLANNERAEMIARHLTEHRESQSSATYALKLKGIKEYLPIIRVNPESLLLNPDNNRLTAQLRDYADKSSVRREPWGHESQQLLHKLLAQTEQFQELKSQLEELKQKEPGLITRDGLLVNGNTRVVALKELGVNYVEVAVLPDTISPLDILEIEAELQLTKYVEQEYTYTNDLLFMKKFLELGGSEKEMGRRKGWVKGIERKVQWHMRTLNYIEEVRSLTEPPVEYSEFDNKRQHLKDLDDDFMRLFNQGDVAAAEALKWNRLASIFLRLNKDQVRTVEAEFIDEDFLDRVGGRDQKSLELLEQYKPRPLNSGFSEMFGGSDDDESFYDTKGFLRDLLKNRQVDNDEEEGDYSNLEWVFRRKAEQTIDAQKLDADKAAPIELLADMQMRLADLRVRLPDVVNESGFKAGKFKFQLKKVIDELHKVETDFSRLKV
ncbi:hypothetical protein N9S57_01940 [Luminiphilus sp.]|nr:hypothetical protein [Luminiphilus sp.]MDA9625513.1 hypothetical protein [Luminiphilus sp.]